MNRARSLFVALTATTGCLFHIRPTLSELSTRMLTHDIYAFELPPPRPIRHGWRRALMINVIEDGSSQDERSWTATTGIRCTLEGHRLQVEVWADELDADRTSLPAEGECTVLGRPLRVRIVDPHR